jgi:inositol transport system substrate-binding protein
MKTHLFFSSAALASVALTLAILGGCKPRPTTGTNASAEKKIVIGVTVLNLSAEYIATLDRAMQSEADKLGVKLITNDAQLSADRQIQQVEGFVAQKLDAVILNPCQVDGSSPAVDIAHTAGLPVINVNSETRSTPTAFVGSRDDDAGRMAMEYISERLHGAGNVVIIEGPMGQAAQMKRYSGAREVLARNPWLKLIASQAADWDRAKAISLTENWLQSYPGGINAIFAENDEMAMGALLALEQAGMKSKVVVIGVDGITDALDAVKTGRLDATIFQDAQGQGRAAVDVAVRIVRRQAYDQQTLIPFKLVTHENIGAFAK